MAGSELDKTVEMNPKTTPAPAAGVAKTGSPSQEKTSGGKSQGKTGAGKADENPVAEKKKATQLGDYKLVKKLGQGGMGEVFLAIQVSLDRKVALKTLSRELAKKEDFVKRFMREAKSMAKIQHPNAVQVYAVDTVNGIHFAAIEFIDGRSMQNWMDQLGKLSLGDALHVVLMCAEALKHAHSLQMIHRDIKPDNILLTKDGVVKVADFGLAKAMDEDVSMTQSGTGLGTPLYMAPEQARNAKHVDQRTDIYALGTMLYYFITGELPFKGGNTLELIQAKEQGTFTPAKRLNPEVPERLDLIIDKMLAKNPEYRYKDCEELIRDLVNLNLENAVLSFIDSPQASAITRSSVGRNTQGASAAPKPQAAIGRTSQEDAKLQEQKKRQATRKEENWFVRHNTPDGKLTISQLTTTQVEKGLQSGTIDFKAKAKKTAKGTFLPLAQFPEFTDLVSQKAVQSKTEQKAEKLQNLYANIEKETKWYEWKRFFRNLTSGALGWVGLVIYLAIIGAVLYGGYLLIMWAYPMVAKQFGLG